MSKQVVDSIFRSLRSASLQLDKGKYEKALKLLEKTEQRAKAENILELIHMSLILKGKAYEDTDRLKDAMGIYEETLASSSGLFFKEPENTCIQEALSDSLLCLAHILGEMHMFWMAECICDKNKTIFNGICDTYKNLIVKKPEEVDYLNNYSKASSSILVCYMLARKGEEHLALAIDIIDAYGKMMELDPDDPDIPLTLFEMAEQFGTLCQDNDSIGEAIQVYERLTEIYEKALKNNPDDEELINLLMGTYGMLGGSYELNGESEKAYDHYSRALKIIEIQLIEHGDSPYYLLHLSKLYLKIGMLFFEPYEHDNAEPYYLKALAVIEELLKLPLESDIYFDECIVLLEELATFFADSELLNEAIHCYMQQINICNSMIESGIDVTEKKLSVAETLKQLAEIYILDDDPEKAKDCYEKEIAVYENLLLEEPDEIDYELSIAGTFNALGCLYSDHDEELSRVCYEKAVAVCKRVRVQYPEYTGYEVNHARVLQNIAKLHDSREEYDAEVSLFQEAIDVLQEAEKRLPEDQLYAKELGNTYNEFADLYDRMGNKDMSLQYHSSAVGAFSRLLFDNGEMNAGISFTAMETLVQGSYYLLKGNYEAARLYLDLAVRFYENICTQNINNLSNAECLLTALNDISTLYYDSGSMQDAVKDYIRCLPLLENMMGIHSDDDGVIDHISLAYARMGMAYSADDEFELSRQAFENSMAMREHFIAQNPENVLNPENDMMNFEGYADLLLKTGKTEEADAYKVKAEDKRRECEEKENE